MNKDFNPENILRKLGLKDPNLEIKERIKARLAGEKQKLKKFPAFILVLPLAATAAALFLTINLMMRESRSAPGNDQPRKVDETLNMNLAESRFLGLRNGCAILMVQNGKTRELMELQIGQTFWGHHVESFDGSILCLKNEDNLLLFLYAQTTSTNKN